MAAELDEIVTFLTCAHTTASVKDISDVRNINRIVDASGERMLVFPGEELGGNENFYTSRYKVKLSENSEVDLMNMKHDIRETCTKHSKRQTIADWTYASHPRVCSIQLINSNKAYEDGKTKRWNQDIFLDVEWSTT